MEKDMLIFCLLNIQHVQNKTNKKLSCVYTERGLQLLFVFRRLGPQAHFKDLSYFIRLTGSSRLIAHEKNTQLNIFGVI